MEGRSVDVDDAEGCSRGDGGGIALGVTIILLGTRYVCRSERVHIVLKPWSATKAINILIPLPPNKQSGMYRRSPGMRIPCISGYMTSDSIIISFSYTSCRRPMSFSSYPSLPLWILRSCAPSTELRSPQSRGAYLASSSGILPHHSGSSPCSIVYFSCSRN